MAAIIPFFIQHRGCPHRCLFCDQMAITAADRGDPSEQGSALCETIELWLHRFENRTEIQLAFYGGSFTCLPELMQIELLRVAKPYLDVGDIHSLRLSTRPDCINEDVCALLWDYGVRTVELGVQSMSDRVLNLSERGHSAEDVQVAAVILKAHGFALGIQLMPGLPGDSTNTFLGSVRDVIDLGPDFVRIYPALVIRNTGLERLYQNSSYQPLSMNRAIALAGRARYLFTQAGIGVIRMGLQPSTELEEKIVAGPYHQAFGELVASRNWFKQTREAVNSAGGRGLVTIRISERDRSSFVGLKRRNILRLEQLFPRCSFELKTESMLERGQVSYAFS